MGMYVHVESDKIRTKERKHCKNINMIEADDTKTKRVVVKCGILDSVSKLQAC